MPPRTPAVVVVVVVVVCARLCQSKSLCFDWLHQFCLAWCGADLCPLFWFMLIHHDKSSSHLAPDALCVYRYTHTHHCRTRSLLTD